MRQKSARWHQARAKTIIVSFMSPLFQGSRHLGHCDTILTLLLHQWQYFHTNNGFKWTTICGWQSKTILSYGTRFCKNDIVESIAEPIDAAACILVFFDERYHLHTNNENIWPARRHCEHESFFSFLNKFWKTIADNSLGQSTLTHYY